jgi:hypothetical protein
MQPNSVLAEKGQMIGPALGFLIPGIGEEEVGMEGIEAARVVRGGVPLLASSLV